MGDPQWIATNYDLQPDVSPVPIDLKLDRQSHVYNVHEDRYVGYTDRLSTDCEPGEALLYALLPYQVDEVYLDGPAQSTVGHRAAFEVSVIPAQGAQPGMHCLHVEVANPDGQAIRQYVQNVIATKGSASFTVPFALSDSHGTWRVTVKDVASGAQAVRQVQLVGH